MRLVLDGRHDLHEPLDIVARQTARDGLLQVRQVAVDLPGDPPSPRGRGDDERAAVGRADLTGDEAALGQTVEDARERRSFVREAAVEIGNGRRRGGGQQREDVRFALRQAVLTQIGEIQTDPVRRSMNGWNQAQGHRRSSTQESGSCPAAADTRGAWRPRQRQA